MQNETKDPKKKAHLATNRNKKKDSVLTPGACEIEILTDIEKAQI